MYYNQNLDKKTTKKILSWFLDNYGPSRTSAFLEELKSVGFHYATEAGISLGFDDLKIPPRKNFILDQAENQITHTERFYRHGRMTAIERYQAVIDIWTTASEKLKEEVIAHFQSTDLFNPLYMMAFSGARGNISQVRQLVGMRGLMSDSAGGIIDFPIRKNFREGLTITEYVISCYGARKGLIDTALRTADSGYLTRRLVDVAHGIMIGTMDCGTKEAFTIYALKAPDSNLVMQSLEKRILGRVCAATNEEISPALAYEIIRRADVRVYGSGVQTSHGRTGVGPASQEGQTGSAATSPRERSYAATNACTNISDSRIRFAKAKLRSSLDIRSPLTCQTSRINGGHTEDICQLCYGWSLAHGRLVSLGEAVGILAAQSIGEPGTQLTMRTFHTGGIFAGGTDAKLFAPHDGVVSFANMADLMEAGGVAQASQGRTGYAAGPPEGSLQSSEASQEGQDKETGAGFAERSYAEQEGRNFGKGQSRSLSHAANAGPSPRYTNAHANKPGASSPPPVRLPQGKKIRTSLGQTAFFSFEKIQLKITSSHDSGFNFAGLNVATPHEAFATPTGGSLKSSKVLTRQESYLSIPAYSLLFVYPGQHIEKNSLCAEISYLMQAKASVGEFQGLVERSYAESSGAQPNAHGQAAWNRGGAISAKGRGEACAALPTQAAPTQSRGEACVTQEGRNFGSEAANAGPSPRSAAPSQSSQESNETRVSETNETPTALPVMTKKVLSDIEGQVYFHRIAERRQKTGVEDIRHVKGVGSLWILNGSLTSTQGRSQCGDFFLGIGKTYGARSNNRLIVANRDQSNGASHRGAKASQSRGVPATRSFALAHVQARGGAISAKGVATLCEACAAVPTQAAPMQSEAQASPLQSPNAYTGQRRSRLSHLNSRHDIFAFQKAKNRIRSSQGLSVYKTKVSRGQSQPPMQRNNLIGSLAQNSATATAVVRSQRHPFLRESIKSSNLSVFSVFWSGGIINKQTVGKISGALQRTFEGAKPRRNWDKGLGVATPREAPVLPGVYLSFAIRARAIYSEAEASWRAQLLQNSGASQWPTGEGPGSADLQRNAGQGWRNVGKGRSYALRSLRHAANTGRAYAEQRRSPRGTAVGAKPARSQGLHHPSLNAGVQDSVASNCELRGKYSSEINNVPEEIDILGLGEMQSLLTQLVQEKNYGQAGERQSLDHLNKVPLQDYQSGAPTRGDRASATKKTTSRIAATRSSYMNSISLHKKHLRQYWIHPVKPSQSAAQVSPTKGSLQSVTTAYSSVSTTTTKGISMTESRIQAPPKLGDALRCDSLAQVILKVLSCRNVSAPWKWSAQGRQEGKQGLLQKSLQRASGALLGETPRDVRGGAASQEGQTGSAATSLRYAASPRKALQVIVRKIHPYVLSNEAALLVHQGEGVSRRQILCELFFEKSKTGDIVQGLPKIEQLFEARRTSTHVQDAIHLRLKSNFIEAAKLYSQVEAARQAIRSIQRILVDEIQMVYQSQGVDISDKHIEIIVRQMTSKVIILDSVGGLQGPSEGPGNGEGVGLAEQEGCNFGKGQRRTLRHAANTGPSARYSNARALTPTPQASQSVAGTSDSRGLNERSRSLPFYADDIIEYSDIVRTLTSVVHSLESDVLAASLPKLRPSSPEFEPIVLGITKRAFLSESWASRASFQEAKKVLMESACESKIDFLSGLKSNLIVGRYIRAGTSFRR